MKISSATFAFGGTTGTELRDQSTLRAKIIAENLSYIRQRWQIDLFPMEFTDGLGGYMFFIIPAEVFKDSNQFSELLAWYAKQFKEDGIPYRLHMMVESPERNKREGVAEYAAIWLPGQEAPKCFTTHTSGDFAVPFLQDLGLYPPENGVVEFVTSDTVGEYMSEFKQYCIDLHTNTTNNSELDRFLGG